MSQRFNLSLPDELHVLLGEVADMVGETKANLVRDAIRDRVDLILKLSEKTYEQ